MRSSEGQLALFEIPGAAPEKKRCDNHLEKPFSKEEQRRFGKMYTVNVRLIGMFSGKLYRKYGYCMSWEDIASCVDIGFLKSCRAWDPEKGKLSTIFWAFAQGECLHYLRSHNWSIKATHKVRQVGNSARKLMALGWDTPAICKELSCSADDLKDALLATSGMAHDVKGFDLHVCPRMTPWEYLEAKEDGLLPEVAN